MTADFQHNVLLKKMQLAFFVRWKRSVRDNCVANRIAGEHGRVWVVILSLSLGRSAARCGVTIRTSIHAGVVHAYINTLNAPARWALIFIPFDREPVSNNLFDQFLVDARSMMDAIFV
jgi:hypothetical protein